VDAINMGTWSVEYYLLIVQDCVTSGKRHMAIVVLITFVNLSLLWRL
jgi:hypothetical protein